MSLHVTPYVLPLLLGGVIAVGLLAFAWRRRPATGTSSIVWLGAAVAIWSVAYALELSSDNLPAKIVWAKMQYLGIVTVPAAWLGLALEFTGRSHWLTRRNAALLAVVPLGTLACLIFEDSLIWRHIALEPAGPLVAFVPKYGPGFWINFGYSYILLVSASALLLQHAVRSLRFYRWQATALLVSALLPWLSNVLYITGVIVLDLTPFAFALSCLILTWSILGMQLFDVVPIARERVVDSMADGMLVLDGRNLIIDVNPSAEQLLGRPASQILGLSLRTVFPSASVGNGENVSGEAHQEITLANGQTLDLRLSPLYDQQRRRQGSLLVFRDVTARKQAEEALRHSEERFRRLTLSSPDTIYIFNLTNNRVEFINKQTFLGYSLEEIRQSGSILGLTHPVDLPAATEFWRHLSQDRQESAHAMSYRVRHKAGYWEWIHNRVIALSRQGDGRPEQLLIVLTSITESKQAEMALAESETRFRQLLETTNVIPWVASKADLRFTYVGPQAADLLGYPIETWYEADFWSQHIHDSDRDLLRQAFLGTDEGQANYEFEFRMRAADGTVVWFRAIAGVIRDESGEDLLRGFLVDMTDRKLAEEKLRQKEEHLRILVEQTPIGIVTVNMTGEVVDANPRSLELLGSPSRRATIGLNVLTLPTLVSAGIGPMFRRVLATGQMEEMESWYTSIWGKTDFLFIRTVPHFDGQGRQIGLIILVEDLTQRIQAEEGMRQMQKLESLGVMAGGIAHDFNNLLVAVMGQTSLALAKMGPDDPARAHIEKAVRAADRAADLTRQLLAYSGQGRFEIRPLQLNALISENMHLFRVAIPKNVALQTDLADDLPLIKADPGQMQQVIMNLIINAAEAIADRPGTVVVSTDQQDVSARDIRQWQHRSKGAAPGPYIRLEVSDNGSGMDRNTMVKVFDPFFTTKFTGRGLGLAAVLGIVRGHRGGVQVDSELAHGTTFRLFFPVGQTEPLDGPKDESDAGMRALSGCVLVIDDEQPVREAVADILAGEGLEVITATDGLAGLAIFEQQKETIQLVLLDLSMPGLNGEETFLRLRQVKPDVVVVLSSGYHESEVAKRFIDLGVAGFLQKPYDAAQLVHAVRKAFG